MAMIAKVWRRHICSLGIRRETKNLWERRVPLTPSAVRELIKETGANVYVQPSSKRIFKDEEYARAGATIVESLQQADVIIGVKEVPEKDLLPEKTFMFFSHTHKGQPHNMPMLSSILERKIRLLDYELLVDPNTKRRTVLFSKFAGYAGVVDGLHGLGKRYLSLGYDTPFLYVTQTYSYPTLEAAKAHLKGTISSMITSKKFDKELGPVVFALTGNGNVSQGAKEVLDCLPIEWIPVSKLAHLASDYKRDRVYAVQVGVEDYIVPAKQGISFSKDAYFSSPENFSSAFDKRVARFSHMIVNGIYWEPKYPRLLTKRQLRSVYSGQEGSPSNLRLPLALADIGCDINGPFEFMSHASTISNPFFSYDPVSDKESTQIDAPGIQIMSIDNLPTQLPLEASMHFSSQLYPHVVSLIKGGGDKDPVLKGATLTNSYGEISDRKRFSHLSSLKSPKANARVSGPGSVLLLGSGYVSAPIIDYFAKQNVKVTVATNNLGEGRRLVSNRPSARLEALDVGDSGAVQHLIKSHNVAVSMLPASLHPNVARHCIRLGVPLVTASYVSKEMQALDAEARSAGVLLLNELGLDPGIDHLTAKRIIDSVQSRGDTVTSFVSLCGGLPAPEDSNNPLRYKFSWSPKGVLTASGNGAIWLENKRVCRIKEGQVMESKPIPFTAYPGLKLEGYPNRDSTHYINLYGLKSPDLEKMQRGTLRYEGYCKLMSYFQRMNLTSTHVPKRNSEGSLSWPVAIGLLANYPTPICENFMRFFAHLNGGVEDAESAATLRDALTYFGLLRDDLLYPTSDCGEPLPAIDAFTKVLEGKCVYRPCNVAARVPGERDLVLLRHEIMVKRKSDGKLERHTSALVAYGSPWSFSKTSSGIVTPVGEYTAMARTVGLPAAIGANLILQGKFSPKAATRDFIGVQTPLIKDYYDPLLKNLQAEGLHFDEKVEFC